MSYESLRVADRFLRWLWNKLYQGIQVENADRVRKLALEGHEIVYVLVIVATLTIYCFPMCYITKVW